MRVNKAWKNPILKLFAVFLLVIVLFPEVATASVLPQNDIDAIYGGWVNWKIDDPVNCDGPTQGGPATSPRFPAVSDTAAYAKNINDYIHNFDDKSGMNGTGDIIVKYGKQYNVNPGMLVGVAELETGLGTTGDGPPPKHNFWGASKGALGYPSYEASIIDYFKNLTTNPAYAPEWAKGDDKVTVEDLIRHATPDAHPNYVPHLKEVMTKLLKDIIGTAPATGQTDASGCPNGSGDNGTVSAEGYAFPLAPQQKSKISAGYPLPCRTFSCHHDGTPAFDLAWKPLDDSTAGAAEYAISDGTIDNVHIYEGISGCYSLQLHSSKDGFWYWYGHIANPRVKSGDTVKAGQQVSEVGPRKCTGNKSYPHLHIDRGCIQNGVKLKGGRGECRDPGINKVINALWESLPD